MTTTQLHKPSGREISYLFLGASLLLFMGMISAGTWWMLLTPAKSTLVIGVGSIVDFPASDTPYRVVEGEFEGWVVNTGTDLLVFPAQTTGSWGQDSVGCKFAWNEASGRFEDPCSGSAYRIDGTVVRHPAFTDLDQYPFRIVNGRLMVDTQERIRGTCRAFPAEYKPFTSFEWREDGVPPVCDE